ncbi:hypothetical protein MJO29_011992 [Puccinia striiformis f. sp. tritici]|nr:hypothetical protein MJO29_011992 [Puccinia striiformis f. sp. tritici]
MPPQNSGYAEALETSQKANITPGLELSKRIRAMSRGQLFDHISALVDRIYGEPLKPLQMQTVINLVHRQHTFVLAGTGFGKTRIAEVYWHLFPASKKPVILVLNPLDTLGNNQVRFVLFRLKNGQIILTVNPSGCREEGRKNQGC